MDRRVMDHLSKIGRTIPKRLLRRGLVKTKPFAFERDLVQQAISDPRTPLDIKKRLQMALDNEMVYATHEREIEEEDPKVAAEIDKMVGAKVARDIRSGKIPPPPKNDPFRKFVRSHMKPR